VGSVPAKYVNVMNDFVTSPGFVIGISIGIGIAATQACMGIAAWLMPPKPCPNCASPIYQWYHYLSIGSGAGLSLTQAFHFSGTCAKCSPDQAVPNASKAPLGWALVGLVIAAAAGWLWWASTQSSNEPAWYLNRGVSRGKEGDLDGAVADFTKAIDLDPRLALAYFNRGEVLIQKGNFDAAIADFTKAIELNPRNGEA
jgi:tetratricopeptide (TPR) repeat protein